MFIAPDSIRSKQRFRISISFHEAGGLSRSRRVGHMAGQAVGKRLVVLNPVRVAVRAIELDTFGRSTIEGVS